MQETRHYRKGEYSVNLPHTAFIYRKRGNNAGFNGREPVPCLHRFEVRRQRKILRGGKTISVKQQIEKGLLDVGL